MGKIGKEDRMQKRKVLVKAFPVQLKESRVDFGNTHDDMKLERLVANVIECERSDSILSSGRKIMQDFPSTTVL